MNTELHVFPLKAAKNPPPSFHEWIQKPQRGVGHLWKLWGNGRNSTEEMNTLVGDVAGEGSKQTPGFETPAGRRWRGNHHDKTPRASVSIFSSSFTPSRPPWTFSGLSRTSTLLVYGSNLTEKGRLMPATYVLRQRHKEVRRLRWDSCLNSS